MFDNYWKDQYASQAFALRKQTLWLARLGQRSTFLFESNFKRYLTLYRKHLNIGFGKKYSLLVFNILLRGFKSTCRGNEMTTRTLQDNIMQVHQ